MCSIPPQKSEPLTLGPIVDKLWPKHIKDWKMLANTLGSKKKEMLNGSCSMGSTGIIDWLSLSNKDSVWTNSIQTHDGALDTDGFY